MVLLIALWRGIAGRKRFAWRRRFVAPSRALDLLRHGRVLAAELDVVICEGSGFNPSGKPRPTGASPNENQPHEGETGAWRTGAWLLADVSLCAGRGDAGLCRLRLGIDRLRAR